MKVTANVTRSGGWWAIEVPEVPGTFTQARRLDQVEAMTRDGVGLMLDIEPDSIEVDIVPMLPADELHLVKEAKEKAARAEVAVREAAAASRAAVSVLQSEGLTVRDVGRILGISPQRASQLAKSPAA